MVRKSLDPWLARVLRQEISAVLEWWKGVDPRIKPDPDSRFRNDHSNLKSVVATSPSDNRRVQLVEVLSLANPTTVVLSDSERTIKARLSEEVVAALEAEAGEEFSSDVTGDVFQLRTFTVISSVLAPSDERVQLVVDEIEYAHHLRRNEGNPNPVHEDDGISQLILRLPNPGLANTPDDTEDSSGGQASGSTQSLAVPRSSLLGETQRSNPQFQTQPQARGKAFRPNLAEDGLMVESGLNLELPFQALAGLSRHDQLPSDRRNDVSAERLKSLLIPKRPLRTDAVRETIHHDVDQQSTSIVSEIPAKPKPVAVQTPEQRSPGHFGTKATQPDLFNSTGGQIKDKTPTSAQPVQAFPNRLRSSSGSHSADGRRKIPASQRKLLEHSSSWIPLIPGQRCPHPNVPIELLKLWNQSAPKTPSPAKSVFVSSGTEPGVTEADGHSNALDQPEECQSSDTSDEDLPWSQSPGLPPDSSYASTNHGSPREDLRIAAPRALPVRRSPPPSRSGNGRSSSAQRLRHPLPARLPAPISDRNLLHSSLASQTSLQEPSAKSTPKSSPQSLLSQLSPSRESPSQRMVSGQQQQGTVSDATRGQVSEMQAARKSISSQFSQSSHARAVGPLSTATPKRSSQRPPGTGLSPSGTASQKETPFMTPSSQWRNRPMVGRRSLLSQPSPKEEDAQTPRVPATQQSPLVVKMELDSPTTIPAVQHSTPTSTPPNPDDTHRLARRKFLQEQKICEWLKTSYYPSAGGSYTFQTVLARYRNSHGDDKNIAARDFMNAVQAAFPASSATLATNFIDRPADSADQRKEICEWFQSRFYPDPQGEHQYKTINSTFRNQYKGSKLTKKEMLDAMQMAFPDVEVTKTTTFSLHRPLAAGLSTSRQHRPSREDRTSQDQAPPLLLPPQQAGSTLDDHEDSDQAQIIPESVSAMKEFCESWLNVNPGGAFAQKSLQNRTRRHVNVLRWSA